MSARATASQPFDKNFVEGSAASSPSLHKKQYFQFLDGFRSIAVLFVIFYHLGFSFLPGGFVGVDIFFVISGFLITGICVDPGFSYRAFYISRVRRIVPAYMFVMLATFAVATVVFLPHELVDTAKTVLFGSLFLQNFYFWRYVNYFVSGENNPLLHTWSLAVEWQFYIILPFVIASLRHRPRLLLGAIVTLFAASFAAGIWAVHAKPQAAFYLTPFRVWEFLAGGLVVFLAQTKPKRILADAVALVGATLVLISAVGFDKTTVFPGLNAVVPCLGATLVIASSRISTDNLVVRLLGHPYLTYIGRASYSIYLVHWPIIVFLSYFLVRGRRMGMLAGGFHLASARCAGLPIRRTALQKVGTLPIRSSVKDEFGRGTPDPGVGRIGVGEQRLAATVLRQDQLAGLPGTRDGTLPALP
jgi:peptidoglycan/LPS O-acetylase OafA/YrhL